MVDHVQIIFHIQLNFHTLFFVFHVAMDGFLNDDYIIHDLSASDESSLCIQDNFSHDVFHSSSENIIGGVS